MTTPTTPGEDLVCRTLIVTTKTTGAAAYRTLEDAESDLLDYCDNLANSYRGCSVNVELCVDGLPEAVINTGRP
jgi:hypothetical protein